MSRPLPAEIWSWLPVAELLERLLGARRAHLRDDLVLRAR